MQRAKEASRDLLRKGITLVDMIEEVMELGESLEKLDDMQRTLDTIKDQIATIQGVIRFKLTMMERDNVKGNVSA